MVHYDNCKLWYIQYTNEPKSVGVKKIVSATGELVIYISACHWAEYVFLALHDA